jgi:D-sedoheptulose 7-phosphate isomerase
LHVPCYSKSSLGRRRLDLKLEKKILNAFKESIDVKKEFLNVYLKQIVELSKKIVERIQEGGGIFFMGNGGSAADAAHLTAELVGMFYMKRNPIKALSFSTNPSILTEIPNDFGFEYLFERQVESHVTSKDVLVVISTSGKSSNIIQALKKGRELGALIVGFTGKNGGYMNDLCDMIFKVNSKNTPRIQETHILLGHVLCELIEYQIFGEESDTVGT